MDICGYLDCCLDTDGAHHSHRETGRRQNSQDNRSRNSRSGNESTKRRTQTGGVHRRHLHHLQFGYRGHHLNRRYGVHDWNVWYRFLLCHHQSPSQLHHGCRRIAFRDWLRPRDSATRDDPKDDGYANGRSSCV